MMNLQQKAAACHTPMWGYTQPWPDFALQKVLSEYLPVNTSTVRCLVMENGTPIMKSEKVPVRTIHYTPEDQCMVVMV